MFLKIAKHDGVEVLINLNHIDHFTVAPSYAVIWTRAEESYIITPEEYLRVYRLLADNYHIIGSEPTPKYALSPMEVPCKEF